MAKHILCTGGAGYIGSHTVVKLHEAGFKVSIMDNFLNSNKNVLTRLKELTGVDFTVHPVDMCDAEEVSKLFKQNKFDGVIHFAGLKAVGESVAKPIWYYENNIVGTLNILKAMSASDCCKSIVFSSSATVYKPCEDPLDEEKPTGCTNPYGWTKYMIEEILIDTAKADSSLGVSILRYFNPVGAHPSGRIGEAPSGYPNNLMPFIQQVAVGRRAALSVFGNDYATKDGSGVRDYIHVEDLAEGHVAAIKNIIELGTGITIHNLGSGDGVSVLEMAKAFEESSGKPIPIQMADRRPGDLAIVVCNPGKANTELKWKTTRTLKDMTDSVWKWVKEHPYGYDFEKNEKALKGETVE